MTTKVCTVCHDVRPLSDFTRLPDGVAGQARYHSQCRACRAAYVRRRRRADPDYGYASDGSRRAYKLRLLLAKFGLTK